MKSTREGAQVVTSILERRVLPPPLEGLVQEPEHAKLALQGSAAGRGLYEILASNRRIWQQNMQL